MRQISPMEMSRAKSDPGLREKLHAKVLEKMTDTFPKSEEWLLLRKELHELEALRGPTENHDRARH